MGVRFGLTSEPNSSATWNDSRIKSLTGDTVISARFMRADFFTFPRTHKTVVIGNHMPRLADVTHAIKRRMQMVPFRAVFEKTSGAGMRERLKGEAAGAILAWIVEGAGLWHATGTAPPECVRSMTDDYLEDQDAIGQWLDERCERVASAIEPSSALHKDYVAWCGREGAPSQTNKMFSAHLVSAGFVKQKTMIGKVFRGLRLRGGP